MKFTYYYGNTKGMGSIHPCVSDRAGPNCKGGIVTRPDICHRSIDRTAIGLHLDCAKPVVGCRLIRQPKGRLDAFEHYPERQMRKTTHI